MSSQPRSMTLRLAVIAVGLVAVVWIALRRGSEPVVPTVESPDSPAVAVAPKAAPQHALPQRQPQTSMLAPEAPPAGGAGSISDEFRTRAQQPQPGAPAPAVGDVAVPDDDVLFEDEPDFEALKRLALTHPDPDKRIDAAILIAASEHPEALSALTQALQDPDSEVRLTVVEMLGDFEGTEPIVAIEQALGDNDPEIRFEALSLLGDIDDDRARVAVQKALHDEDEDVRDLAAEILDLEADEEAEGMDK